MYIHTYIRKEGKLGDGRTTGGARSSGIAQGPEGEFKWSPGAELEAKRRAEEACACWMQEASADPSTCRKGDTGLLPETKIPGKPLHMVGLTVMVSNISRSTAATGERRSGMQAPFASACSYFSLPPPSPTGLA